MKKALFALLIVVYVLSLGTCTFAGNDVSILKGEQDYLALASVKDIEEDSITITVDRVLGNPESKLVGKDLTLAPFTYSYCELHTPSSFNMPVISDNIVISLNLEGNKYVFNKGAYKVDSNDHITCRIINYAEEDNRECILELAEITCYIRSDGKVNSFEYDSEGNIYAVYPQKPDQCIVSVDNSGNTVATDGAEDAVSDPIVVNGQTPQEDENKRDFKWIYAIGLFILGAGGGLLVAYVYMQKKPQDN